MSLGDDPGHGENLRVQGQQQALQAMQQSSVDTYVRMLNSASLFPFLLYQQSLAMAAQVARVSLTSATGVARQGAQAEVEADRSARGAEGTVQGDRQAAWQGAGLNDEIARQSPEAPGRVAQGDAEAPVLTTRELRQNIEVAGETKASGVEMTGRTLPEVDKAAPDPSDPVSSPASEPPKMPPDEPAARAVDEADQGSVEPSSRAEGGIDEAIPGPSSTLPPPDREESVVAEEPPPGRKASPAGGAMELSPPPEESDVDLPPPPPVPQNILDEMPPPPPDEPTARTARGEKPRIYVRRSTAAAARRKAEELNVNLDEIEGTGRDGQITVGDVRKKAEEKKP